MHVVHARLALLVDELRSMVVSRWSLDVKRLVLAISPSIHVPLPALTILAQAFDHQMMEASFHILPGSHISLSLANGDLLEAHIHGMGGDLVVSDAQDLEVMGQGFARVIGTHLAIPEECII